MALSKKLASIPAYSITADLVQVKGLNYGAFPGDTPRILASALGARGVVQLLTRYTSYPRQVHLFALFDRILIGFIEVEGALGDPLEVAQAVLLQKPALKLVLLAFNRGHFLFR